MQAYEKLSSNFYNRANVLTIAAELLGKVLVTHFDGLLTAGRIVETEAYAGEKDMASHARHGLRTQRTEIMYSARGKAYVYLCYGIHHLFNIVTNKKDIPHAILIRAIEPIVGIDIMHKRSGRSSLDFTFTRGPGNVSKAMGILTKHSGMDLRGDELFIARDDFFLSKKDILATKRIGVDYAGKDAGLPYRFILKNNRYVSIPKK